jgi:hypothetical protein
MLLTLTGTSPPATDLGYLLHKNPAAVRGVPMSWGDGARVLPRGGR